MKLREWRDSKSDEFKGYWHWCPGCNEFHVINTVERNRWGALWTFDGNTESPTFSPSINLVGRCHYFIRNGRIEFCGDSNHSLAGQTVPLPDVEDGDGFYERDATKENA